MTDKVQKIRKEVEKLKSQLIRGACSSQIAMETCCKEEAYNEVLAVLDTVQEESVSEDLEDAVIQICQKVLKGETIVIDGYEYVVLSDAEECFKAGAQWKKEQMMSKAIDALVHTFDNGYIRVGTQLLANNKYGLKVGSKVKVIVIRED